MNMLNRRCLLSVKWTCLVGSWHGRMEFRYLERSLLQIELGIIKAKMVFKAMRRNVLVKGVRIDREEKTSRDSPEVPL